jgi:SAM-dependent methyltransferase
MRGIEVGPSYRPICPKKQGWNTLVVDHATKSELVAKYTAWNIDTSLIEDVDVVLGEEGLNALGPKQTYDYILASHVIEHIPNPIGFLRSCADLLKPGARLRLAVPDKRFCFDLLKQVTTTGQLIQAHSENRRIHTLGQVVDALMLHVTCNGQITFPRIGAGDELKFVHLPIDAYTKAVQVIRSHQYYDIHGWVFTPSSFLVICSQLAALGVLPFRIISILPDGHHEFLVDAIREDSAPDQSGVDVIAILKTTFEEQARAVGSPITL